ncbi:peptidylprolyl isomerase [Paludisphaera borealis]|uniref:peptidylprolyl isomerase n=1 Tax=Paludisphaera borealis TaxID=1387353 RepID=A0A1U7CV80_9BACT|nr:peptidylprolyl isomerase [Paludisphaera borealis]APW62799.1 Peptidyl-prolyl cis-trans isomerase B [Paludisphaera borealis]
MWDRILRKSLFLAISQASGAGRRVAQRSKRRPILEGLEERQLMTASLAPIGDVSVPAAQGYQLTLDGSGTTSPKQTFTATSDNADIKVNVAQGQFWTINVTHLASTTAGDVTFINQPMTFQFFPGLTPNTVDRITNFTNTGYYTDTGKYFPRILSGFVAQGGSNSPTSTSSSSGTPGINTEISQQLAFNSVGQLAMANSGTAGSSDAQFFITFGPQPALNYNYTIFGQQVSGFNTLTDMSNVTVHSNGASPPEVSVPDNPVTINSATLSDSNPNGVLLIDTTSAHPGEKANITVTATDPSDGTTSTQTFVVYTPAVTGAVRQIGDVLIATPVPGTWKQLKTTTNTIEVNQVAAPTIPPSEKVQVVVNGVLDSIQPAADSLSQIVAYGSKASDKITVSNDITIPATIDGGRGGKNVVTGGGGYTLAHGWFGRSTLVAGSGYNKLIGRQGQVRFRANKATALAFTGRARGRASNGQPLKPGGTYYRFINNHLVPVLKINS